MYNFQETDAKRYIILKGIIFHFAKTFEIVRSLRLKSGKAL